MKHIKTYEGLFGKSKVYEDDDLIIKLMKKVEDGDYKIKCRGSDGYSLKINDTWLGIYRHGIYSSEREYITPVELSVSKELIKSFMNILAKKYEKQEEDKNSTRKSFLRKNLEI